MNGNAQNNAVTVNALLQQQVNGGNLLFSNATNPKLVNPNAHRGYSSATAYDLTGSNGNNQFISPQQSLQKGNSAPNSKLMNDYQVELHLRFQMKYCIK